MTAGEFRTFRLFMFYLFQTKNNKSSKSSIRKLTTVSDTLSNVLCFLYADIARFVTPELPEYGQIEGLSLACYDTNTVVPAAYYQTLQQPPKCPEKWTTYGRDFFDTSFALKINALSNAALNADLDEVKHILEKSTPEQCKLLLSTTATATITHLGVKRIGTPLQMALYSDDEEMVAFFKEHMEPAEFQRQWIEVIGPDYPAFLKKQETEAEALCSELEDAFNRVGANEITCDNSYVTSTTCKALQNTLR